MTGESHVRDCMSVMRALACETHVPTVKLWLMVLNLYLVLSEGHTNWQESVWMLPMTEGYWSSNHVFRA